MIIFKPFKKLITFSALLVFLGVQVAPLQAAMVPTTDLSQAQGLSLSQAVDMMQSSEVRARLVSLGVDPLAAGARVRQMTDRELAALNASIDEMPAGQSAGGILLTLFIVFVITDMLGATDIFPFVKNINN